MLYNRILEYSKNLFDNINYEFRFFDNGNSTILSASFGVQLNFLLNTLTNYPIEKICINLKKQQDKKTGLFIDDDFNKKQIAGFEEDYILWQFTYFATVALDMLEDQPQYSFNFLIDLKHKKSIEKWINHQNFENFWYSANKIMFLLYFLTYEQERLGMDNVRLINHFFNILDSKQEANTGFWGLQNGASILNGMFGASHIYLYYDFYGREINYKNKIIDNVLRLENSYRLFGSKNGGACEDYDPIEILSVLMKHSNYKYNTIKENIYRTYDTIRKNQNRDGGFSYNMDNRNILKKIKDKIEFQEYYYSYSGWDKMRSNCFKSDLWGTYFRTLTIAKIEKMLRIGKSFRYRFYSLPGWGYY